MVAKAFTLNDMRVYMASRNVEQLGRAALEIREASNLREVSCSGSS
jgi:hypothetical protein